jgi:hypothetical protein
LVQEIRDKKIETGHKMTLTFCVERLYY